MSPVLLNNLPSPRLQPSGPFRLLRYILAPERTDAWHRLDVRPLSVQRQGPLHVVRFPLPFEFVAGCRRIVFFSDLHWSLRRHPLPAEPLIKAVNDAAADWIVFGGDLVHALDALPEALEILGALRAGMGKVAVLGNWETRHAWLPLNRWKEWFASADFRLLSWDEPHLEAAGTGVRFRYAPAETKQMNGEQMTGLAARATIAVAHSPDTIVAHAEQLGPAFCLAGHTHGGQIRLPVIGPVYASSRYGVRFAHGWYRNRHTDAVLYVTAGVGCTGRDLTARRIYCPPEIAVFDMRAADDRA